MNILRKFHRIRISLFFSWIWMMLTGFSGNAQGLKQGGLLFSRPFSPQEGLTKPVEKPYRDEICLSGSWQFQPVPLAEGYNLKNGAPLLPGPTEKDWSSVPIRIPSPWNINAFTYSGGEKTYPSYPSEWEKARMGWLRRSFTVPANWKEKRLIIHFEAVCGNAQVYINGKQVAEHFDNSLPFEADITDFVEWETENVLLVGVRQPSLFDVPGMFGQHTYPSGSPWTRQMTGIWQDVYLQALPTVRISDIAVRPLVDKGVLELEITIANSSGSNQEYTIAGDIVPWISKVDTAILSAPEPNWTLGSAISSFAAVGATIGPRTTTTIVFRKPITNELKYWTPETPNLYGLILDIKQNDKTADRFYQRFGWRQWGIQGRDVTLNGKPYKLLGESGHLLGVPYMSRRYAWAWYKAIKDLNGNAIRLHANLRPRFYLELADEMGVAIMDESEIYASTMEINYHVPETWQRFHDHIDGMVLRDRNYPSVFGWSIANEILSALWWKGIPRKFWPPVLDKVVKLADRVKALDPTRPWISSDGDGDFHGRLPTYIYHYGKPQDWNRQAPKDKPFGIGEGGSMLWGSSAVFSTYNGERSYESRQGMYEGIAIETYWYLTEQRKMSAFTSIFTVAGSCFQPMQLGVMDAKGDPYLNGVRFGSFAEGQPGMQPERLPAKITNFNPGYDLSQPLYKVTPVFEAVKAAYAPGGPASTQFNHRVPSSPRPPAPKPYIKQVAFNGDEKSDLKRVMESAGIVAQSKINSPLLVIDGASLNRDRIAGARSLVRETLKQKSTVFLWVAPVNIENVNALLSTELILNKTAASALYADRSAPETASLALADLYFQDQSDKNIVTFTLAGPLAERGRKLIQTNTFSRRWFDDEADDTKAPVMIAIDTLGGRLIITSLTPDTRSEKRLKLIRDFFANLGVELGNPNDKYNTGFDGAGFLNQALLVGSFQGTGYPKILDIDFIGNEAKADPQPGDKIKDRNWTKTAVLGDGLFDFFRIGIPGTEGSRARSQGPVLKPEALDANNYLEVIERVSGTNPGTNSVVYASFWIYSPQALESSQLTMQLRSDDGVKVWINTKQIFEDNRIYGPGITDPKPVPTGLNAGWNHLLLKIGQLDGPWNLSVRFESSEPGLIKKLRASATKPI